MGRARVAEGRARARSSIEAQISVAAEDVDLVDPPVEGQRVVDAPRRSRIQELESRRKIFGSPLGPSSLSLAAVIYLNWRWILSD